MIFRNNNWNCRKLQQKFLEKKSPVKMFEENPVAGVLGEKPEMIFGEFFERICRGISRGILGGMLSKIPGIVYKGTTRELHCIFLLEDFLKVYT